MRLSSRIIAIKKEFKKYVQLQNLVSFCSSSVYSHLFVERLNIEIDFVNDNATVPLLE